LAVDLYVVCLSTYILIGTPLISMYRMFLVKKGVKML